MQLAITCFLNYLRGFLTQNVVLVVSLFLCCTVRTCNSSSDQLRLSDGIGSKFKFPNLISVSQGLRKMSEFLFVSNISQSYFWSFRGRGCLANNSRLHFYRQLFYAAFFQQRLVRNDGADAVGQNSFLRRGQVNSVLCVLCRSSMNLIIYLPRLLDICSCFYFVCIAVGEENCLIDFLLYVLFLLPPIQLVQ